METILANLPMALCLLLGMGLIIVEVFLPGFGLPGVAGIALVGVGTIMAAMHFGTLTAVALLLVIIAVLAVLISWLLRSAAKGDMGKSKLFLHQKDELCDQQQDMQVAGRNVPLSPGMTATAEVKIRQKRIIEFFLDPFRKYKSEALRER